MPTPSHIRFFKYVEKTGGCWLWRGAILVTGYGLFRSDGGKKGIQMSTHRYSWIYHFGEIPKGKQILHKCDVRNCVNPKHLFIGTHSDNMRDKIFKNRQAKGEMIGASKLTENQVIKIRELHKTGKYSQRKLASMFGVTQHPIRFIIHRKSWSHI